MFNLFKKSQPKGTLLTLHINGMHCAACSLNIDGELEDLPGVYSSKTSYAKAETTIDYDPDNVTPAKFKSVIKSLGYDII